MSNKKETSGIFIKNGKPLSQGGIIYSENLYPAQASAELESFPGFRILSSVSGRINGFFDENYDQNILIHAKNSLFRLDTTSPGMIISPLIADGLYDRESCAVSYGKKTYLVDGKRLIIINKGGRAEALGDSENPPYIPTAAKNGRELEPRNFLTEDFYQKFTLSEPEEFAYGSPGLEYAITDTERRTCALISADLAADTTVYIPKYALIGSTPFAVTEISSMAFRGNTRVKSVITNRGLLSIGDRAFYGCSSLREIKLSDTVRSLGDGCFEGCASLNSLYLGRGFIRLGELALNGCEALDAIDYGGNEYNLLSIEGIDGIGQRNVNCNVHYGRLLLSFPLLGRISEIKEITSFEGASYTAHKEKNILQMAVSDRTQIEGMELVIYGSYSTEGDMVFGRPATSTTATAAVNGCTLAAIYDGRLFLSGNSMYPGIIFFSRTKDGAPDPGYFGRSCYLEFKGVPVSMVTGDGCILVTLSDGKLLRVKGSNGEYTVTETGARAIDSRPILLQSGELAFPSKNGLVLISAKNGKALGTIRPKSPMVRDRLASVTAERYSAEFFGKYPIISNGKYLFLVDLDSKDSRGESIFCNFYTLCGVGSYTDDRPVFRYAESEKEGYILSDTPDLPVTENVFSRGSGEGLIYYQPTDKGDVLLRLTEERTGGTFYPLTKFISCGERLFFGNDIGDVCLFNNDLAGIPPDKVIFSPGYNAEEYLSTHEKILHPSFYSYGAHSVSYILLTEAENGDFPGLEKLPVDTAVNLAALSSAQLQLTLISDQRELPLAEIKGRPIDFSDFDFSALSFDSGKRVSFAIREGLPYTERQYKITSSGFCKPIFINSISHRFKIRGRIRNK